MSVYRDRIKQASNLESIPSPKTIKQLKHEEFSERFTAELNRYWNRIGVTHQERMSRMRNALRLLRDRGY